MKKTIYNGYNLWNGYKKINKSIIQNDELENEIPGFHFIKEPCNPCVALDNNYTCPFQIVTKNDNHVSEIWKNLWGL